MPASRSSAPAPPWPPRARRASGWGSPRSDGQRRSKLLLRQRPEGVRHTACLVEHDGPIADRFPAEAIADLVHGFVGGPARGAGARAGPAQFVVPAETQFQM